MTETVTPQLKACPFCGGAPEVGRTCSGAVTWVSCSACDVERGTIEDWNLRSEDRDARKAALAHGYVLACCSVVHLHDEPEIAFDILEELGITEDEVSAMDLCEYDAEALTKIEQARTGSSFYSVKRTEP